ncbi:hypothetical protein PIB30_015031 [Stylosanthes scabra]|uniref:Uncharacterized protein n=1 Tax=Stylosanthes scabra TaxID=79078 RepID=A0ABU6Y8P0_9FABA|nr:hypothetical protein [Stylosanthes scabra]
MRYFCSELPRSSGILVNTFKAIEEGLCFPDKKQRPPVYYIGPFIADPAHHQSPQETKECLSWLDKQPSKSVVEQHVNRNVLVEDMKVAVAVDQTGGLVSAEEL